MTILEGLIGLGPTWHVFANVPSDAHGDDGVIRYGENNESSECGGHGIGPDV